MIVFGDLESWVIWANLGINQSLNLEKISKESNEMLNIFSDKGESLYLNNVQRNEPKQGVNSTSIAEISGIPRATVLRKLKKLLREKVIKKNKNLEYVLTDRGKLNDKIQANFIINQRQIALFVTDIFNLIKKTPI